MAKTYDLKRVLMTVNGVPVSGFDEGEAVTVEFNEDAWKMKVGADGEAVRSKTNNRSGKLTFNVLYSSSANNIFESLRLADELTNSGQAAIYLKDLASGTEVFAARAWVTKSPNITFGQEAGAREWVFETGEMLVTHVGIV